MVCFLLFFSLSINLFIKQDYSVLYFHVFTRDKDNSVEKKFPICILNSKDCKYVSLNFLFETKGNFYFKISVIFLTEEMIFSVEGNNAILLNGYYEKTKGNDVMNNNIYGDLNFFELMDMIKAQKNNDGIDIINDENNDEKNDEKKDINSVFIFNDDFNKLKNDKKKENKI
jgi:hypothetical protein